MQEAAEYLCELTNFDSFLLHIFILQAHQTSKKGYGSNGSPYHIHSLDLGFQLGVVNLLFRHFERERVYRQRYSGNGESEHGVKKSNGSDWGEGRETEESERFDGTPRPVHVSLDAPLPNLA
jgi:hypothetical protein